MMPFWFLRNLQEYQHIKYASRKYRMMLTNEQGYSLQIQITLEKKDYGTSLHPINISFL